MLFYMKFCCLLWALANRMLSELIMAMQLIISEKYLSIDQDLGAFC